MNWGKAKNRAIDFLPLVSDYKRDNPNPSVQSRTRVRSKSDNSKKNCFSQGDWNLCEEQI